MKQLFSLFLFLACLSCAEPDKPNFSETDEALFFEPAVSSVTHEATQVGIEILKNGGNAFDAAVAIQFALAVTYPRAGNLGGGGFAVISTSDGRTNSIDFREKAPLLATKNMYCDASGELIKDKSILGALAAGVPGTVSGMWHLHKKYGSLTWNELIMPSVKLARNGFTISRLEAIKLNESKVLFDQVNPGQIGPFFKEQFEEGDTLIQEKLAKTLQLLADSGISVFYGGQVGEKMVNDIQDAGGIITKADLEKYEAVFRAPVEGWLGTHRVISMGPPSSGGVALIQLLNGAQMIHSAGLGHNSAANLHLYTEMMRRVYADRTTHLGDPDFHPVPVEKLVHPEYLMERYRTIDLKGKTNSEDIKAGKAERIESYETTHFSVLDREGNAVSMTVTLNSSYGCKLWLPSVGFFLNNEMDDFVAKKGVANQFGLLGGSANAIEPEKRMLSSMTPTIILDENKPILILGTPGGSTIITTVFQVIMNVMEFDMPLQEAIDVGRIHHQWQPDYIAIEKGKISAKAENDLRALGHMVIPIESLGIVNAIQVNVAGKTFAAADTTRYMGSAIVLAQ
ncbi:MAG: gamma-glutamyltransferase [Flavobacteriales bacterium]|nr:gamma-glutamyltransferase [Flavobacteriales bacterium]